MTKLDKKDQQSRGKGLPPVENHSHLGMRLPGHKEVLICQSSRDRTMRGLGRTPKQQALENITQALRALELAPKPTSDLIPHPLDIVRVELQNVARYVALINECE